jgi:hypothetical protein
VRVGLQPEDLSPAERPSGTPVNVFKGLLSFAIFADAEIEAEVRCQDTALQGHVPDLPIG